MSAFAGMATKLLTKLPKGLSKAVPVFKKHGTTALFLGQGYLSEKRAMKNSAAADAKYESQQRKANIGSNLDAKLSDALDRTDIKL